MSREWPGLVRGRAFALCTVADDTGWLCLGIRAHGWMAIQLILSLNSGVRASTALQCLILGLLLNFWAGQQVSTWWSGQAVGAAFGK